jgi:hypothetical protein
MTKPKIEFVWQLSVGHVLQVIAIVTAGVVFALRLESRIEVQEVRVNELQGRLERTEGRTVQALREIQQDIKDIKQRLILTLDGDLR